MLKRNLLFGFILFVSSAADAQYYYKDIVSNKQVVADMKAYRDNKVRLVTLKSLEAEGTESEGFFCEKKISRDFKQTELFTRADLSAASLFTSKYDSDGYLLSTNDSSSLSVTNVRYSYDDKKRIQSVLSSVHAKDEDFENSITEEHIWSYDANGIPDKMRLIKNGKDTVIIMFSADENGNVGIEKNMKNGSKYFYYYDSKKHLTDIVSQDEYSQKMKPNYMFEYNNSAGLVSQMTTIEEGSSHYFIWKYNYENGMRTRERCFSDEKRLMGSIEYEYK